MQFHFSQKLNIFLIGIFFLFFLGCSEQQPKPTPENKIKVITLPPLTPKKINYSPLPQDPKITGSLLSQNYIDNPYAYPVARKKGDIILIRVSETPSAETQTQRSFSKNPSYSNSLNSFLGVNTQNVAGLNFKTGISMQSSTNFQSSSSGKLSTKLENIYISAKVIEVLPNGNLFILGKKQYNVNGEELIITISGEVSPRDISPNNIVDSTRISNLKIIYNTRNYSKVVTSPGWLYRLITGAWPW